MILLYCGPSRFLVYSNWKSKLENGSCKQKMRGVKARETNYPETQNKTSSADVKLKAGERGGRECVYATIGAAIILNEFMTYSKHALYGRHELWKLLSRRNKLTSQWMLLYISVIFSQNCDDQWHNCLIKTNFSLFSITILMETLQTLTVG